MPWINDVVPYTTILSAWGNNIRNHVVHQFNDKADRDANGHPVEGMLCFTAAEDVLWIYLNGAWNIESMPWKQFTVRGWFGLGGPQTEIAAQTPSGWWTQRRGICHALITAIFDLNQFNNIDVFVYLILPLQASVGGAMGTGMIYQTSNGLMYGGAMSWADNFGSQSRAIVNNVGNAVPPNATIRVPAGNTKITAYYDVTYMCNPTTDSAP